jgi:long-chain acyl-CoA synthetase
MEREHLAVMVKERMEQWGGRTVLRYKDDATEIWKDISMSTLGDQARCVAKGLMEMGIDEREMVAIFSPNRPEWAIADYGTQFIRAVSVPIYATNSAKQAQYIVDDAEIKAIFVGDQSHYDKVKSFTDSYPQPKKVIAFSPRVQLAGDDLYFQDLLEIGRQSGKDAEIEDRLSRSSRKDVATLIYTSGTTGDPKGVMLTHANFFHQIKMIQGCIEVDENDVSLCFLPLSHVFERTWSFFILHQGAVNSYCSDFKKVGEYFQEVKPTLMVSVPRLFEKIFAEVFDKVSSAPPWRQKLFHWALEAGKKVSALRRNRQTVSPGLKLQHYLADALVLHKVRGLFGGRIRVVVSGGAPLSRELEEFFHAMGILICQGYGLTETSPSISCNTPACFKFGTVGKVVPGCEVKLSPEGEVLVKGENLMLGYYKKPDKTAEAFDGDWFKTGDVGEFDSDGFLKITDRIKDLLITSGGKNISPQNIESSLSQDPYIEQIAVIGNRRKFVSALIVPSFAALQKYFLSQNLSFSTREELIRHPQVLEFYAKRIKLRSKDLADCEKIKNFCLIPHEFSLEGGELTPTLKLKRKVIEDKYADLIESLYKVI